MDSAWRKRWWLAGMTGVMVFFLFGWVTNWTGREGIIGGSGVPLAGDLLNHWVAGRMVAEGRVLEIYRDSGLGREVWRVWRGGEAPRLAPYDYVYPPLAAGLASLASGLPYLGWAMGMQVLLLLCHGLVYALLRQAGLARGGWEEVVWWWGLPVMYHNLLIGQNAGLSLLFMAGAMVLQARGCPVLGGLVAAGVCYKPQVLVPVALVMAAAGRGRFLAGMLLGGVGAYAVALAWLGADAHAAWLDAVRRMASGSHPVMGYYNASLPAWVGAVGGMDAQRLAALIGFGVMVALGWWLRGVRDDARLLAIALATGCMASPYVMFYDWLLAAPAWMLGTGGESGAGRWGRVLFWWGTLIAVNPQHWAANPGTPLLLAWWVLLVSHAVVARPGRASA